MSLTLTQMRSLVRKGLGNLSTSDISDDDVDLYLNMAFWAIEDKFPFKEKECEATGSTVEGQASYSVPTDLDAIITVGIDDDDTEKTEELEPMDWDEYYDRRDDGENDSQYRGKPEYYIRRDDAIYLHPVPDEEYTFRITFYKNLQSLLEGSVEATGLPRNWDEMVVEGAIERAHFYFEDYNLAQQVRSLTMGKEKSASLAKNKEKTDARFAGVRPVFDEDDKAAF